MNKIVCDVCGTSYAESVTQCPICGCVRSSDACGVPVAQSDEQQATSGGYTYVKGGRFSKSNVKKRVSSRPQEQEDELDDEAHDDNRDKQADKGLLVAFIVLLLSVAAVVCYILVKFLSPETFDPNSVKKPDAGDVNNDSVISTEQNDEAVACEDITLVQDNILLSNENKTLKIEFTLVPADTTDEITFTSSDEDIATVSEDGEITAVGKGDVTITITCGDVEKSLSVTCDVQEESTVLPNVPSVDLPSIAPGFELNRSDFTLFKKGESWTLYNGSISSSSITWTSSNPKVATVTNGKVTAVSAGKAVITAEYQGSKLTCTVYCKDSVGEYVDPEQNDQPVQPKYKLNKTDVTISVGEYFTLKLTDENGDEVDATFTSESEEICTVSGNEVLGEAPGKVNIVAKYDGQTFVCIVRVKD